LDRIVNSIVCNILTFGWRWLGHSRHWMDIDICFQRYLYILFT